ncbi:hypothetical protein [Streptomyces sp. A5-4]|uniref:hypothetical protein n=1 Tax=Streptomyces sp. A5-4 TaxID=3384771 RepID=UPI003DA99EB3
MDDMDDNVTGREPVGPRPWSPTGGPPGPYEQGAALAAFVGQEFAVALRDGLRRARTPVRAAARAPVHLVPVPPPVSTAAPTPGAALLDEHAKVILLCFENALPLEPALAGPARRGVRISLLWWARRVFATARRFDVPGAPDLGVPGLPVPSAHQQTAAVSLLVESASLCLPFDAPAGPEAIRTLTRVVRLTGAASAVQVTPVRSAASAEEGIRAAGPARRRPRAAG